MIVQAKEAAASSDMEPAIIENLQALHGLQVVAVQAADDAKQLVPTKELQFVHGRVGLAKQIEMAFECGFVALGERPRVRCRAAFLARQQIALQSLIEPHGIRLSAEGKRHREHVHEIRTRHSPHSNGIAGGVGPDILRA